MRRIIISFILLHFTVMAAAQTAGCEFERAFNSPPESSKPSVYWYWLSGHISKEGITRDLEAMAEAGIGEAFIGNIYELALPQGPVEILSEEWWQCIEHAVREAQRVGVKIGLFNCPGWSQSGGPWVSPDNAMRFLNSTETRVTGGSEIRVRLTEPDSQPVWRWYSLEPMEQTTQYFRQVKVQAFPVPAFDGERLTAANTRISSATPGVEAMFDGDSDTTFEVEEYPVVIDIETDKPYTLRSASLIPAEGPLGASFELQATQSDGTYTAVAGRDVSRKRLTPDLGGLRFGPATETFEEVTSTAFRVIIDGNMPGRISEMVISPAARVPYYVEKQLGKMPDTDKIFADTYMWADSTEPSVPSLTVETGSVIDLTDMVDENGILTWNAPPGEWIILRTGMSLMETQNAPAVPAGTGYEIDKMSKQAARMHFDSFVGEVLRRIPPEERQSLCHVVADSYEQGPENWTDGFAEVFREAYGYDPYPWLPVLTGRIVESAERSDRFLWDLRRLIADQIPEQYVGGLREECEKHGLRLWLENYGHWGFPAEFLNYGGASHDVGGEFWLSDPGLGPVECRCASSAGHIYGKPVISAEAFTSTWSYALSPRDFKARGDWSWTEGINHFVFHVYIHQPDERRPGVTAWFGTDFNRHSNWFGPSKPYFDYVRRSTGLLQAGRHVADVAYFIGEDAPKMGGDVNPPLPKGYDYDFINGEVLRRLARGRNGRLELDSGASYRLLVLPDQTTMRPEMLEAIARLVEDGVVVLGPRPLRSPSNADYGTADEVVRRLAARMWRGEKVNRYGQGYVLTGMDIKQAMELLQLAEDVLLPDDYLYTHRTMEGADTYFISYQGHSYERIEAGFRVTGRQPELWDPVRGEMRHLPEFTERDGKTWVPLEFAEADSWFVVFRKPVTVSKGGVNFPKMDILQNVGKTWTVRFESGLGAPRILQLDGLEDLSKHTEPGIRYFSGTMMYSTEFRFDGDLSSPVYIDLGQVEALGSVTLNGNTLPFMWRYPYRADVSGLLLKGVNRLEVEVVNTWWNRLIGDQQPGAERYAYSTFTVGSPDSELLSSGLIGPVTLVK